MCEQSYLELSERLPCLMRYLVVSFKGWSTSSSLGEILTCVTSIWDRHGILDLSVKKCRSLRPKNCWSQDARVQKLEREEAREGDVKVILMEGCPWAYLKCSHG